MSEILTSSVAEAEYQTSMPDNSGDEYINPEWDDDGLYGLVFANADVLVRVDRMGGAVMTLSDAMNAHPGPWTPENEPNLIAEVHQLLANRVTEPEEPAAEEEPEEKELAKTEVQKMQEDSKAKDAEKQSQKETNDTKHFELSASRAEIISESEGSSVVVAKAEAAASSSNSFAGTARKYSPGAPEALALGSNTSGSSTPESVTNESKQEIRPIAASVEDQPNETQPAAKTVVEAKPAPDRPELATDQETEFPALSVALEAATEPELTEPSTLDLGGVAISDDTTQLSIENIEEAEYEPALVNLKHEIGTSSLASFDEEEILMAHYEEVDLGIDELGTFSILAWEGIEYNPDEPNLSGQMGITSPEQLAHISLTIEEIEDSLIQLAERIETSKPETTEKVDEILDKIINLPTKLEVHNGENIITEVEAQEELEELFAELLNELSINYSPELIESLAYLTLKGPLADEIEKLKDEEENSTPQASGTHKIIKKLLAGLSTIKKAIAHACAIGKSALQLYITNFAA